MDEITTGWGNHGVQAEWQPNIDSKPWCRVAVSRIGGGDISPFRVAIVEDISERKRAEFALQESAIYLRNMLDNIADSVVTIDENGIIRSYNASARKAFGYTPHEVVGKGIEILMPGPHDKLHDA